MKILIIGSNGFLGSHLYSYYEKQGAEITNFSFRSEEAIRCVSRLEEIVRYKNFDLIINAGACQESNDDSLTLKKIIDSNVYWPAALASISLKYNAKACMINFGTSWQIDGEGNNSPFNAYAASKTAVESFYDHFKLSGLRIASLRLYDTYGKNDRRKKIINLIADALIFNKELLISPGMQALDFVYVDDVVSAVDVVYKELKGLKGGVHLNYSIRSYQVVTILEVINMMRTLRNEKSGDKIISGAKEYRDRERFKLFKNSPQTPPAWSPKVGLKEGLAMLLSDREKNPNNGNL